MFIHPVSPPITHNTQAALSIPETSFNPLSGLSVGKKRLSILNMINKNNTTSMTLKGIVDHL